MTAVDAIVRPWRAARAQFSLWQWAVFAVVAGGVGVPLVFLVLGSFSTADLPTEFSLRTLGFENYLAVWFDPATYRVFFNTFVYVTGATAFGISIAAVLAWLVERTDMPGKIWIYAGVPMTLAMPGMLQAMAWVLLASPRIGFINQLVLQPLGLGIIDIYSLGGMIFVEGLRLVPTAFLMLVPLLRAMDPALEEAAAMSGASPQAVVRRVTVRLMAPGLIAVTIYSAMTALEVFEVPGVLGLPAKIYVFSTKIYTILNSESFVPVYGEANALSMFYLAIAVAATALYARMIGHSERYTVISGKGYRPTVIPLGRWRMAAFVLVSGFAIFAVVLPLLVLVYVSLIPFLQVPSAQAFANMSLVHYERVFANSLIGKVLWNTVILVVVTSTATTALSFLISLIVVRSKFWGRKLLDQFAFLPHAIPGIVMGVAFIWVYLKLDQVAGTRLYGGLASICIAFVFSFIAYGTRSMNAALLQIHKDLEEAAQVSGAPLWRTWWRIFYPLLLPTFIGVWVWVMLHVVRLASLPLVLYQGPDNQVLAVLIWNEWDAGHIQAVGAIGTMMIVVLLLMTLVLRFFGFGRSANLR